MADTHLGNNSKSDKIYFGSQELSKIYFNNNVVYEKKPQSVIPLNVRIPLNTLQRTYGCRWEEGDMPHQQEYFTWQRLVIPSDKLVGLSQIAFYGNYLPYVQTPPVVLYINGTEVDRSVQGGANIQTSYAPVASNNTLTVTRNSIATDLYLNNIHFIFQ